MSWTTERISQLQELVAQGKTAAVIAVELGDVTRNGVIGKLHRLGVVRRDPPTPEQKEARRLRQLERDARRQRRLRAEQQRLQYLVTPAARYIPQTLEDLEMKRVSIADLDRSHCRYVIDGKDEYNVPLFCGNDAPAGPYCVDHHQLCTVRR